MLGNVGLWVVLVIVKGVVVGRWVEVDGLSVLCVVKVIVDVGTDLAVTLSAVVDTCVLKVDVRSVIVVGIILIKLFEVVAGLSVVLTTGRVLKVLIDVSLSVVVFWVVVFVIQVDGIRDFCGSSFCN